MVLSQFNTFLTYINVKQYLCVVFLHKRNNMKTINTYVMSHNATNMDTFIKVANTFTGFQFNYITDMEQAIEATNAHTFDLLIIDKAMDKADEVKLNKVVDLIHPDVATLDLHMNDEEFIRFKLNSMLQKWEEAHSDSPINFVDNPKLS